LKLSLRGGALVSDEPHTPKYMNLSEPLTESIFWNPSVEPLARPTCCVDDDEMDETSESLPPPPNRPDAVEFDLFFRGSG